MLFLVALSQVLTHSQQWLALTPPQLVKAHLDLSDEIIAQFNKSKLGVVGGRSST